MRKRPKELWILAGLFLGVAAAMPLQIILSYGYGVTEIPQILAGLAPLNWAVMGISMLHAFLVFRASSWALLSTIAFVGTILWNNWVVAETGLNYSVPAVALASLGAIGAHIPMFSREVRRVLLNPKMRWWRTAPRKRTAVQAVVRPVLGGEIRSRTFDLSSGGAFISMEEFALMRGTPQLTMRNLRVGSRCSIRLLLNQLQVIHCPAEIVRHAAASGEYPAGFAVRFVAMDDSQRKLLSEFILTPPPSAESLMAA